MKRFRGGLALKAHRLVYHSTLDVRGIKKKKKIWRHTSFGSAWGRLYTGRTPDALTQGGLHGGYTRYLREDV